MREIPLSKGKFAIVDDEDYEELSKHAWHYGGGGYALRRTRRDSAKGRLMRMHIEIMGKIEGLEIDHINGDSLDNRKSNLRHVTKSQNNQNQKPNRGGTSSAYKGVYWHKQIKRWVAKIKTENERISLGCYKKEEDAAAAYNAAAAALFGEYARLNMIKEEEI